MTANDVYVLEQILIDKFQSGYFSPEQFNSVNSMAQRSWMANMLGGFQSYTPGRPIARVELGQNSVIRERLAPAIVEVTLTINGAGFSSYPSDYLQTDAMWDSETLLNRVRLIQQEKLFSVANSTIDPVATNPIYVVKETGFQFYPISLGSAVLSYVKNPPDIVWNFTPNGDGIPVYNATGSQGFIFDDTCAYEIIVRAMSMMGLNLQIGQVMQYAEQIKQGGQ